MGNTRPIVWPWDGERKDGDPVFPWPVSMTTYPTTIRELKGRRCRFVNAGESVPADREPGRVTVFLTKDGRIADIYLEPDLAVE